MIDCKKFYDILIEKDIEFFTGVPDSLLKDFCAYITNNSENNIIVANEGNAIALATGYYLSTNKIGLVYMQNSGQGNSANPLISLADPEVYGIPLLLFIGWRGEPGEKDEPQHIKQGKITLDFLKTLGIPYQILPENIDEAKKSLDVAINSMKTRSAPYALVVRKGTFEKYELKDDIKTSYELSREDAIKLVVDKLDEKDIVVSTTGKISRELFEYREKLGQGHEKDFLTVGSMGHSSSIALGIALQKQDNKIYCFDGDGAVIMHMGALSIIGSEGPKNFKHIIFNNGAHDSVGGQPTVGFNIDFPLIAKSCGYKLTLKAETRDEVERMINLLKLEEGPCLLEIRVNKGSRDGLGRPTRTPKENKEDFMKFLKLK
jgi:phosphonopyruvate decarboxylase